jgi:ppGpp synthetase/RelA/SpoT-type nucleotidyltranferase
MPGLSAQEIRTLGKKLRDGEANAADLDLLDQYRIGFESTLFTTAHQVGACLKEGGVRHILAGRIKRTKSIVRKLRRPNNQGMDLSRMSDVVGIRVILSTLADQDRALALLRDQIPMVREPYDYRDRVAGYRAIHIISGSPAHRVEIQLRTCAQHYWADQSEQFGEHAKEGELAEDQKTFLDNVSMMAKAIDAGTSLSANTFSDQARCNSEYSRLGDLFKKVSHERHEPSDRSFVVVYDSVTNSLLRADAFSANERPEALSYFRSASKGLDETRYDILVLNSGSKLSLAVTHPRYFPEVPEES